MAKFGDSILNVAYLCRLQLFYNIMRCSRLTICGRRMLARLRMRAWLRPDSSMNIASFFSSMSLFSSSMLLRFFSMDEIYREIKTFSAACYHKLNCVYLHCSLHLCKNLVKADLCVKVSHVCLHLTV